MRLTQAIEGFAISRISEGYSPPTISSYRSSLGIMAKYLDDPEVDMISHENLRDFMLHLRTNYKPSRPSGNIDPLSSASHHRYWKAIRSFFRWAKDELNIPRPDLQLKMPEYTNKEIVPLTDHEIIKLLKACEVFTTVNDGKRRPYQAKKPAYMVARNKAILLLLLDTGIRSGECCRLKIKDVNLENGEVSILPHHVRKTRPRTVYMGKATRKAVWKYLTLREEKLPEDSLFTTNEGRPMTQPSIRRMIYNLAVTAKLQNIHPHKFRHTFAIQYLRNGGDVFTLQRLLGHKTLEMVRHYLALADSDAAEAHQRSSPVDRWRL